MTPFLDRFDREFAPLLGTRGPTFRKVFELLESRHQDFYTLVETGVAHLADAQGRPACQAVHGHSTLLFDAFVNSLGGLVYSVDCSPAHCEQAERWVSEKVRILCQDSRAFLSGLQTPSPIDCVYFDSMDVDWVDPHASALHHLEELCAILPRLREGCILFVDDAPNGWGKCGYILDVMERIGARLLFDGYQMGWQLTAPPPAVRPLGRYDPDEMAFVLARSRPRRYRYVRASCEERILELLPDGRIGHGSAPFEERWFAERDFDGRIGLALAGRGRVTARLAPTSSDDSWRGRWFTHDRLDVELLPLPAGEETVSPGRYWLQAGELGARSVELLASHDIWGRGAWGETWRIEAGDSGAPSLVLSAAGRETWRFHKDGEGIWRSSGENRGTASLEFLDEVRDGERQARAVLAARRLFRYSRVGDGEWPIELIPDGTIGRGATRNESGWDVEEDASGEVSLLLFSHVSKVSRLVSRPDGTFTGLWPLDGHPEVRLEPLDTGAGSYLRPVFAACLPRPQIRSILEVGCGDCGDTIALQRFFDADVTAFESNPDMLPLSSSRVSGNPRIRLVAKAVGATEGIVPFYRVVNGNPHASACFRANPAYPWEHYIQEACEVEMVRLDRWLEENGAVDIDLLAIDAQGGCLGVLQGLGAHLERVRFLIAEIGQRPIYHGEALAPEVIDFLAGRGFQLLRCFDQWGMMPDGQIADPSRPPHYAGLESWFGDYLFVRPTAPESALVAEILGQRFFRYVRLGHDERTLELAPNGQIGVGAGGCERNWIVQEQPDGRLELLLVGLEQVTCRLAPGNDGRWRGRWVSHERMPVILEPLDTAGEDAAVPMASSTSQARR